ncbi:hypothetical protein KAR91_44540 [Candidatus Pacearchaeota archaeon]|nr:hypothetical protein [Candidatus Pacearchaeota archaeon]
MPEDTGLVLEAIIKGRLDEASIKAEAEKGGGILSKIFSRAGNISPNIQRTPEGGTSDSNIMKQLFELEHGKEEETTGLLSKIKKGGMDQAMKLGGILTGVMALSRVVMENPFFKGILQVLTTTLSIVLMPLAMFLFFILGPPLFEFLAASMPYINKAMEFFGKTEGTRAEMEKAVSESSLGGALEKIPGGSILKTLGTSIAAFLWESGMFIGDTLFDIGMWIGTALWDNVLIHFFDLGWKIGDFFTGVLDDLSSAKDSLLNGLSSLIDWGSDIYNGMMEQINSNIDDLGTWGSDVFDWMKEQLDISISDLDSWGTDVYDWMKAQIDSNIDDLLNWGPDVKGWMEEKLTASLGALDGIGQWIRDQIESYVSGAVARISSAASSIMASAREKLSSSTSSADDFISRPGMGITRISPQDTVVGFKGGLESLSGILGGGGGGDTIVKVYIDGKELKNAVRTEIQAISGTLGRM